VHQDVGEHALVVVDGPPLAGAAGAGLDLVGDEQEAMLVAEGAEGVHVALKAAKDSEVIFILYR
jgi:hypothetical protein